MSTWTCVSTTKIAHATIAIERILIVAGVKKGALIFGEPLLAREGEVLLGTRQLDMRRGLLLSAWTHRTPAGITATGRELRLLSLADRAAGLQFLQLALDRDGIDVRLEASFAMAGLGMEPVRLEQDLGACRTEGTRKGVAMTPDDAWCSATTRGGGETKAALSEIGANLAKLCWTSSISAGIICLFIFLLLFTV